MNREAGCGAIVATYRPDLARLDAVLAAIAPQPERLWLVDDGSGAGTVEALQALARRHGAQLLLQAENRGLGAALNRGLRAARAARLDYALLLDQDSTVPPGLLATLAAALRTAGAAAAAAGPAWRDARDGKTRPFRRFGCGSADPPGFRAPAGTVECDFLISSGCLLRLAALEQVGALDERLFIDNIDLEWCFRARAAGLRLLGVPAAVLDHTLGDARLDWFGARWLPVPLHPPDRHYYMTRNRSWLYTQPQTPRRWVLRDLPKIAAKALFVSLLLPPRRANAAAVWQGLRDARRGRLGPRAH